MLDWEICTLGDPLADVGMLQVYWTGPGDVATAWGGQSTTAPGFWDRAEVAARYAEVSGRDISRLDFYVAFGYWKLACILEGVYARYLGGALGERDPAELEPFRTQVDGAARSAAEHVERLPVSERVFERANHQARSSAHWCTIPERNPSHIDRVHQ